MSALVGKDLNFFAISINEFFGKKQGIFFKKIEIIWMVFSITKNKRGIGTGPYAPFWAWFI